MSKQFYFKEFNLAYGLRARQPLNKQPDKTSRYERTVYLKLLLEDIIAY